MTRKNQDSYLNIFKESGLEPLEEMEDGRFILSRTDSFYLRALAYANNITPKEVLLAFILHIINTCDNSLEHDIFRK